MPLSGAGRSHVLKFGGEAERDAWHAAVLAAHAA